MKKKLSSTLLLVRLQTNILRIIVVHTDVTGNIQFFPMEFRMVSHVNWRMYNCIFMKQYVLGKIFFLDPYNIFNIYKKNL